MAAFAAIGAARVRVMATVACGTGTDASPAFPPDVRLFARPDGAKQLHPEVGGGLIRAAGACGARPRRRPPGEWRRLIAPPR